MGLAVAGGAVVLFGEVVEADGFEWLSGDAFGAVADGGDGRLADEQQKLHAVRVDLPGPLRDRPAVLARQVRQQTQHQPPGPPPGLNPLEPASDPPQQALERLPPTRGIYAVTRGHRLLVSPHNSR